MAKLLILDGHSRTGKSTAAHEVCKLNKDARLVALQDKMPMQISNYFEYYTGCIHSAQAFLKSSHKYDIYVMDRSILSEFIFAPTFNRPTIVTEEYVVDFAYEHEIVFIGAFAAYNYYRQTNKDSFIYTQEQWHSIAQRTQELMRILAARPNNYVQSVYVENAEDVHRTIQTALELYKFFYDGYGPTYRNF